MSPVASPSGILGKTRETTPSGKEKTAEKKKKTNSPVVWHKLKLPKVTVTD